jgi:hypothetical protein
MSVFDKCREYEVVDALRAEDLYTYYRKISSPQEPVVTMEGKAVVMLGSNNYLGLANHPEPSGGQTGGLSCAPDLWVGLRGLTPAERHPRHPRGARGSPRGVHEA